MSSFTENLYLKRMIQQLHEENLKLKSLINETQYPRYPFWETMKMLDDIVINDRTALHPNIPLTVDDADTGSAPHPGEEGAVDDMPTNPFPVSGTGRLPTSRPKRKELYFGAQGDTSSESSSPSKLNNWDENPRRGR